MRKPNSVCIYKSQVPRDHHDQEKRNLGFLAWEMLNIPSSDLLKLVKRQIHLAHKYTDSWKKLSTVTMKIKN